MERPICPLMKNYFSATNRSTQRFYRCDDWAWRVRKLYPKNFPCCRDGKCFVRRQGEGRKKEMECSLREKCRYGEVCPGPEKDCEAAKMMKEKEKKFMSALVEEPIKISFGF